MDGVNKMQLSYLQYILLLILEHGTDAKDKVRSPLGPQMCDMLCRYTYGCSAYVFSRAHLTCCVACQQSDLGDLTVDVNNTEFQGRAVDTPCKHLSMIIYSKRGKLRCATGQDELLGTSMKPKRSAGLLITQYLSDRPGAVYRYSMTERSHDVYTNVTLTLVKAMAYCATKRTLLTSSAQPDKLLIAYMENGSSKLIQGNVVCNAMTLDNTRGIFVLAILSTQLGIYKLATNGTSFTFMFNIVLQRFERGDYPSAISMDTVRDLIYVCLPHQILSVDYAGKTRVVYRGVALHGMSLNPSENALYFGRSVLIKKLTLLEKKVERLALVWSPVFSVLYHEDHLFYNLRFSGFIYSIHVKHTNRTFSLKIGGTRNKKRLVVCFIP